MADKERDEMPELTPSERLIVVAREVHSWSDRLMAAVAAAEEERQRQKGPARDPGP